MTRKILSCLGIAAGLLIAHNASAQQPSTSFVLTQAPCNNNGILTANFSNITPPLNVEWHLFDNTVVTHSGVTTTSDALTGYSGVALYVTASSATTATDGYYQGAQPFHYTVSAPAVTCPALGTATATPTGGTAPYTYQWYDVNTSTIVSTTNPATGLPPGQYGILITDANGCTSGSYNNADSIFINSTPSFDYTVTATTASCTNGTATVGSITGSGVAPYTYQWSNGATSAGITGLTAGNYTVTVTDALGCQRTRDKNIQQSIVINANTTPTPATCLQNDGSIITFGSGGMPPYSYHYDNGVNTQINSGLSAGSYNVTVTDANGCIGHGFAYVNASTPINVTYSSTPSSCTGATGTAALTITGGQAPYTVTWSTYPVQTGASITGLAAGNYAFHITDANGCVRTGTVPVPPQSVVAASLLGAGATCTQSNGSLSVTATGGTAPYSYLWSNGSTTSGISGLAAGGYYTVTVTDVNGCHTAVSQSVAATSPVHIGLASTQASCIFTNDGTLSATVWGGATPYTYQWSTGQTTSSISGLAQGGPYYVSVVDANGCTAGTHAYVGYNHTADNCYCTISGKVYNDANGNCTLDASEAGIQNIAVNCSGVGMVYTNANGEYAFKVPSGTYTLSQNILATYPLAPCQSNSVSVTTVAASGCVQTVNFADTVTPLHDIHISLWASNGAIPGFSHSQNCIISNQGTITESGILAGYKNDGQLGSVAISPSGVFSSPLANYYSSMGNTVPSLAAGANTFFSMGYMVPANIPLNTALVFQDSAVYSGPMSNWVNDYSPWNNVNYVTENVVGAWDPNFMQVNTQGEGTEGYITRNDSTLNYMVHFQNEGNYYAQNVVVVDTLSSNLDWKSLRPIYSSHNASISIDEHGVLKYTFPNIQLPAKSMNEPASNGMFVYSIKLKPNLPYGTQIKNNAGIIFDFNEPVITNGVLNTIKNPTNVHNVNNNRLSFGIYPNPTQQGFTAVIDNTVSNASTVITITDISGRTILTKELKLASGKQLVPMSTDGLRDGIYFVNINVAGNKGTQKLVIVK